MAETQSLTLPAKLNLFDAVSARPYWGSPEYIERSRKYEKEAKAKKTAKIIVNIILWLALAAFLVYLFFTGHTFLIFVAGIIGAIICGKITSANSPSNVSSSLDISKENEETCQKVINELMETNFQNSRYIYSWGKAVIYNNDVFAYMSFYEELLIIYSRKNFKNIEWKDVEGSHGNYGDQFELVRQGQSNYVSIMYKGTGYKREIQVEISTDYIVYPIIKFNVPANDNYNEQLKILGSILR